jgi:hypothetical protein
MANIDNYEDVLNVYDIIARAEELDAEYNDETVFELDDEDVEQRRQLGRLLDELRGNGGGHQWHGVWYPSTLVRDSYFTEYAQELAEEIGAISSDGAWPYSYIDWESAARELQMDYTSVEYDGVTYWYR